MESHSGMILTGENQTNGRKTCTTICTLSTTNPTWTDLGTNLSLHSEARNNCLSCGTASGVEYVMYLTETGCKDVKWTRMGQDKAKVQALNTAVNLVFHKRQGSF
jgi:hypothetical protein